MKSKILKLFGLFLIFVLVLTPASLINQVLPAQNKVSLVGISGSIWFGTIEQISAQGLQVEDVDFSINPLALLTAKLSVDLDIPRGDILGSLNLALDSDYKNSLMLNDVELELNAQQFQKYLPVRGVEIQGDIETSGLMLRTENKKPAQMSGQVSWQKAGVGFAGNNWSLGDFIINIRTDEAKKEIIGELQNSKNELGLQGKVILSANGMLEFVGSIATDIDKSLYNAVALFNDGKPANGRLPIRFKQKVLR